jgi:hypothetical protein
VEYDSPLDIYPCRKKDEYLPQQTLEALKNEKSISKSKVRPTTGHEGSNEE